MASCYAQMEISEQTDGTDDVVSTSVLRYNWLQYLIRSMPEYAFLCPRPPLQEHMGMVPKGVTIVFSLIKRKQTLESSVLTNVPGALM